MNHAGIMTGICQNVQHEHGDSIMKEVQGGRKRKRGKKKNPTNNPPQLLNSEIWSLLYLINLLEICTQNLTKLNTMS